MGIEDSFTWYQKKIGTYDKQQWETTIEQRIFNGITHIPMRSTKPNTDLIDLDLVRGSSFTKAKPQHGFVKVTKLATLRCIFLPFYFNWWIQQTSKLVFGVFTFVYVSLSINIFIYYMLTCVFDSQEEQSSVILTELIIPFLMLWTISVVLSQIVSTKPIVEPKIVPKSRHYRRKRSLVRNKTSKVSFADTVRTSAPKISIQTVEKIEEISTISHENDTTTSFDEGDQTKRTVIEKKQCICGKSLEISEKKLQFGDDGFESLCGSRTSEEEPPSPDALVCCEKCDLWIDGVRNVKKTKVLQGNRSNSESRACSSDTESDNNNEIKIKKFLDLRRTSTYTRSLKTTKYDDTEEEYQTFFGDTNCSEVGVTTNSEECSYSSDMEEVSDSTNYKSSYDNDYSPTAILKTPTAKVSCTIWERKEIKKADLSMLDISSSIIRKVDSMPESMDYFYIGIGVSTILAFLPISTRLNNLDIEKYSSFELAYFYNFDNFKYEKILENATTIWGPFMFYIFGSNAWERVFIILTTVQRFSLAASFFFLLSVAERTFKQRFLYAKLFCHLTSFRRAQKSKLPHFRLNKVRNIRTWLSVRSYLKKRGPQRSVDVIVSTAFIIMILLMSFLCIELLKDTLTLNSQYNLEAVIWCIGLGILLLRFLTVGTKINKKYRNLSVLLTEQINLHLQIEQKPHKKEELTVANNVLKLAIDLLKELESPFKIIGLSANPILVNITKVVILSALSGVLSDMLGFKLKLHKIKIK